MEIGQDFLPIHCPSNRKDCPGVLIVDFDNGLIKLWGMRVTLENATQPNSTKLPNNKEFAGYDSSKCTVMFTDKCFSI